MVKINQKQQIKELEENHKRVLADYHNQQRRHQEMSVQMAKMAAATVIEKILVSLDSLEIAQSHLKDSGLQMVIDQMHKTLETEGLEQIKTAGEVFDPYTMDCVEVVVGEKDQVVETVAKGFRLYEKVLRPAKVKVGNGAITKQ